jgi:hypothetical protein
VIGDAKFRGNAHQHIVKALVLVATVFEVQEGLTSKMCHNCQKFECPMSQ